MKMSAVNKIALLPGLLLLLITTSGLADTKTQYETMCAACHGFGIAGAPKLGDAENWTSRIAKGREVLYKNALDGFVGENSMMPPKGGFAHLTDDEVRRIVDFMVESVSEDRL